MLKEDVVTPLALPVELAYKLLVLRDYYFSVSSSVLFFLLPNLFLIGTADAPGFRKAASFGLLLDCLRDSMFFGDILC